jgi:DNA-binding transcriptional ArsR family regulator
MSDPLNAFFFAISDPTRRAIVEQLAAGEASVSTLAAPHKMALPTFMKHLRVLEKSGLVRTVKKGRVRMCRLEAASLMTAQGWLAWQRTIYERQLDQSDQLPLALETDPL